MSSGGYSQEEKRLLLDLARRAINRGLSRGDVLEIQPEKFPPRFREKRATFVTLKSREQLRGCMGSLEARVSLAEDVARNAFMAAFRDPRFLPLAPEEFDLLDIHISVLSPQEEMVFRDENDLLRQIRPGIDGLVFQGERGRATFLPSVWEAFASPREFLNRLKAKAGYRATYWSENVRVFRYTAESFP